MNELSKIYAITDEITIFLKALTEQREEQRLFQFLNGPELQMANMVHKEVNYFL